MSNYVIVLASGLGTRLGNSVVPKHVCKISGVPILAWTVDAFLKADVFDQVIIVVSRPNMDATRAVIENFVPYKSSTIRYAVGASDRMQSFMNGYRALAGVTDLDDDVITLADANRPFVSHEQLLQLASATERYGSACLARPVINGVAEFSGQFIVNVPEKHKFVEFVTPEAIMNSCLVDAIPGNSPMLPSLVDIALDMGMSPYFHLSDDRNSKLTYPEDVSFLENIQAKYNLVPPLPKNSA